MSCQALFSSRSGSRGQPQLSVGKRPRLPVASLVESKSVVEPAQRARAVFEALSFAGARGVRFKVRQGLLLQNSTLTEKRYQELGLIVATRCAVIDQ